MNVYTKKMPVPKQEKGAKSDTVHAINLRTPKEATSFFKIAKKRLLDVSNWHRLCGLVTATFTLTDDMGKVVNRFAKEGDHIRINIPGPGPKAGDGYDWVKIISIGVRNNEPNDYEELAILVKPAKNPLDQNGDTAHFFQEGASSTFMVVRKNNIVKGGIHGRNELPNVEEESKLDIIRNALIALGAMSGLAKFQWKKLMKGILSTENT